MHCCYLLQWLISPAALAAWQRYSQMLQVAGGLEQQQQQPNQQTRQQQLAPQQQEQDQQQRVLHMQQRNQRPGESKDEQEKPEETEEQLQAQQVGASGQACAGNRGHPPLSKRPRIAQHHHQQQPGQQQEHQLQWHHHQQQQGRNGLESSRAATDRPDHAASVPAITSSRGSPGPAAQATRIGEMCDTVGCVVVGPCGAVAAGVSSGGLAMKTEGRVGEAAVHGCGCWADDLLDGDSGGSKSGGAER